MSCGCENKRLAGEMDRVRKLAKALAKMGNATVAIYTNPDGTYGFGRAAEVNKPIVEYITQY